MKEVECVLCEQNEELLKTCPGPWQGEPNRVEFRHAGFPCILHRGGMGAWCGYVGVPSRHPWYGKDYDDIDAKVHGGLTYAAKCSGHICHIPQEGESEDTYWLGFDCGHWDDVIPGLRLGSLGMVPVNETFGTYKNVIWVTAETKRLAEQAETAAALAKARGNRNRRKEQ